MTTLAHYPDFKGSESYRLSADLTDSTRSRSLTWAVPGEADQDELILRTLGIRGWGRLHHFRMLYQVGWGDGGGKPASPRAVHAMVEFLKQSGVPEDITPSLFLTDRGGIELAWEEKGGTPVQVEFYRDGIEIYHEAKGLESELGWDQADDAAALLTDLVRA